MCQNHGENAGALGMVPQQAKPYTSYKVPLAA